MRKVSVLNANKFTISQLCHLCDVLDTQIEYIYKTPVLVIKS